MTFDDEAKRAADKRYDKLGEPATFKVEGIGTPLQCLVKFDEFDDPNTLFQTGSQRPGNKLFVRRTQIPVVKRKDTFDLRGSHFVVQIAKLDRDGIEWVCDIDRASP